MTDFNLFSISKGLFESIYNMIKNFILYQLNNFIKFFTFIAPDVSPLLPYVQTLFDMIEKFCLFILDASLIEPSIFTYLIASITFRISSKLIVYVIKIIVKWWDMIFV